MDEKLISELQTIVVEACRSDDNAFGFGIWSHHIDPMVPIAQEIARQIGADEEIVTIAVLLHDYAGIKDKEKANDHHIHGAAEAERILHGFHYPQEKIELVKLCILSHRSSVITSKDSREEICVADADAIVHIQQLPSLFYGVYAVQKMGIDEGAQWIKRKIKRDWDKLSENRKKAVREMYDSAMNLLS